MVPAPSEVHRGRNEGFERHQHTVEEKILGQTKCYV
jgi:hypothetical protein